MDNETNALKKKKSIIVIIVALLVIAAAVGIGLAIYNTPANRLSRQLDLGQRYLEEQNYEQAIVEFDKAIEIDPMSVEAYLGKAQAYEGMGDTEMAMQTLEAGYERTEDDRLLEMMLSIRLDLGQRYLEEQNYEQAAVEFDKAIEIDPMSVEAYLGKAKAYEGMGDIEMAMQTLETGYERTGDERLLEMMQQLNPIIEWEDAAVEAYIREYLGKPEGDIRKSEVCKIVSFELENANIQTLNDLKYFTAVRQVMVRYNNISDISGLEGLTNLESLYLEYNNISDISALSGLTNLTTLLLGANNISDISAVAGLTNLTYLAVDRNNISDISAVAGLTNLTSLSLHELNISDISAVAGLTNLTWLGLYNANVSDISALSGLTNLKNLNLSGNNISDISALGNLTNLEHLEIRWNNISDISVLRSLPNLTYLALYDDDENDIGALGGVAN